jgi:hypothetical protein
MSVSFAYHLPLQGESRTAAGSPGWGDGEAADDGNAVYAPRILEGPAYWIAQALASAA